MKKIAVIAAIALIAGLLVLANHLSTPRPGDRTFTVSVTGMHCAGCVVDVRKALFDIPGMKKVRIDAARATATAMSDSTVSEDDLLRSIERRGYRAEIK